MRRRLISRLRRRDERGAFAIIFAALVVMLMVIAAFTVDLGQAYVSKRQLQTAADAGALAAVHVYQGETKSCGALTSDPILTQKAKDAATTWAAKNQPEAEVAHFAVGCDGTGGITVDYTLTGTTPQVFGGLVTGHKTITTAGTAQATIGGGANVSVGNLRPWGICSAVTKRTGVVAFVPVKNSSTTSQDSATLCGSSGPPGGWWIGQCVGQSNGTPGTKSAVALGCDPAVAYTYVPDQASHNGSPSDLYNYMGLKCPKFAANATCLSSDTGKNPENQTQSEWQGLVGTTFTMPVYCAKPDCSQLADQGGGNGGSYAIEMIATVQLCGFFMKSASTNWPNSGPCKDNNPYGYSSNSVTSGSGLFVVITDLIGGPVGANFHMNSFNDMSLTR